MDKKSLRQKGRDAAKLAKDEFGSVYDKQITERFFATQYFMPRTIISAYMSIKGEVSCEYIVRKLGQMGHITCLPVIMGSEDPMIFREYTIGDSTKPGLMGQLEPLEDAIQIIPDVLLVPMLGFNRQGYRLGYGSGFYDRTINALRAAKPIKVIGLAYGNQEMPELAPQDHDAKMDLLITENEIIPFI